MEVKEVTVCLCVMHVISDITCITIICCHTHTQVSSGEQILAYKHILEIPSCSLDFTDIWFLALVMLTCTI